MNLARPLKARMCRRWLVSGGGSNDKFLYIEGATISPQSLLCEVGEMKSLFSYYINLIIHEQETEETPWEKAGRELHEAWRELIIVIGKSLKIDKLCDWLIKHNL
jgi:hypothetical protein